MKTGILFLTLLLLLLSYNTNAQTFNDNNDEQENTHRDRTNNFTVQRLIIINDNNEVLMSREEYVWATPSLVYTERQYLKDGLDILASAYLRY